MVDGRSEPRAPERAPRPIGLSFCAPARIPCRLSACALTLLVIGIVSHGSDSSSGTTGTSSPNTNGGSPRSTSFCFSSSIVSFALTTTSPKQNADAPAPVIVGQHDEGTTGQMKNCMSYGN